MKIKKYRPIYIYNTLGAVLWGFMRVFLFVYVFVVSFCFYFSGFFCVFFCVFFFFVGEIFFF